MVIIEVVSFLDIVTSFSAKLSSPKIDCSVSNFINVRWSMLSFVN